MPSWSDFAVTRRVANAISAPPSAPGNAISLGPSAGQTNPSPIQKVTLVGSTTSNPTVTAVVEGSLDNITWFLLLTPAAPPTVGVAKRDTAVDVNVNFVRLNVTALSAGNVTYDILISGDPA